MEHGNDPWSLIQAFAKSRGVSKFALGKWRERGVPWKQRFELRELYPLVFSNPENFGPFSEAGKPGRKPKAVKPRKRAA